MKTTRMLSLDLDLIESVRNKGFKLSTLVNDLLTSWVKSHDINQMDKEELEKFIAIEQLKLRTKKEIQDIQDGRVKPFIDERGLE